MSKDKMKKGTSAPAEAPEAELIDAVPEGTPTGAELTVASEKRATAAEFMSKFATAGEALLALGEKYPAYEEAVQMLSAYTATRVEGVMGDRTVVIPRIGVRQRMTKDSTVPSNCKVGEFYASTGECLGPKVQLIPVLHHNKRTKFVQGNDRPECSSEDGVTGSKYGPCNACPYSRFEEGAKAACSRAESYVVTTPAFDALYQLDFSKTSAKYGKKILQTMSARGIFGMTYELTAKAETNKHGEFYVTPVMPTGDQVKGERFEIARAISQFATLRYNYFAARRAETPAKAMGAGGGAATGSAPSTDAEAPDM